MNITITPKKISGVITAPPSKSYSHRAVILAALAEGTSVIQNLLLSEDILLTLAAMKQLGANITVKGTTATIIGTGGNLRISPAKRTIFCGYSGTSMRLLTGIASLVDDEVILDGEQRLRERPIGELTSALTQLGVQVEYPDKDGYPPIKLHGGIISGGEITVSGKASSQFISALLLIAPFAKKDTTILVTDLVSGPYVDITIDMMKTFGVNVERNESTFSIAAGQRYTAQQYTVEGDYSSASYFFAAGAITQSEVTISNLNPHSVQGDKQCIEILKTMGSQFTMKDKKITIHPNLLIPIDIDMNTCPDIVPTIAIICASTTGTSTIKNIAHLRIKETDRIEAVATELKKMGATVETTNDSMTIRGGKLHGAEIETYNDHRIAMSFAVAGLVAEGKTEIKNADVVAKSYPGFWNDMKEILK
jgi:3-phosphoshikimate 1-carboxyvinyltransferase